MKRFPLHALMAGSIALTLACPAFALPSLESTPLNSGWTAGAIRFAPAHLDRAGEAELSIRPSFDQYETMQGPSTTISLQFRALDNVLLYADYGKLTQLGLRGPLSELAGMRLGWDAALRHDTYMLSQTGAQVLVPFTRLDAVGWGGDFRLNGQSSIGALNLYYAPLLSVMSNRWGLGLEAGAEVDLAGWILGANAGARYHFGLQDAPAYSYVMQPFEDVFGLGVRKALTDTLEANVAFQWQPENAYGIPNHSYTAGLSWRVAQKASEPLAEPIAEPIPEPVMPTPTPASEPAPISEIVEASEELGLMLSGRIYSSLSADGTIPAPVTVRLKRRLPGELNFVTLPETVMADAQGHFRFTDLLEGEYQVFFKDESGDETLVDYALADAVTPDHEGQHPVVELDVAWRGLDAVLEGSLVSVAWAAKPGLESATYQGLVRGRLEGRAVDFTNFPERPSDVTTGRFAVTPGMELADELTVVIKYWKPGNAFAGSGYYGQSKPIHLKHAQ